MHEIEAPKSMVGAEIELLKRQQLENLGIPADKIDQLIHKLPDDNLRDDANKRVCIGLLMGDLEWKIRAPLKIITVFPSGGR